MFNLYKQYLNINDRKILILGEKGFLASRYKEWSGFRKNKFDFLSSADITDDIASAFGARRNQAERMKCFYGSATASPRDNHEMIEVAPMSSEDEGDSHRITRAQLIAVIRQRPLKKNGIKIRRVKLDVEFVIEPTRINKRRTRSTSLTPPKFRGICQHEERCRRDIRHRKQTTTTHF